jgi:hypothetical protein
LLTPSGRAGYVRVLLSSLHEVADGEPPRVWWGHISARVPEPGIETVWKIDVEDFPAFIVVDDKGNDFFAEFARPVDIGAKR